MDLVKSYISERTQVTVINDSTSSFLPLSSSVGVPQGPIMGPLFFLIYVDDLCFATTSVSLDTQFADDTAASVGVKSLNELQIDISHTCSRISKWIDDNKLVLNKKKTKLIILCRIGCRFPKLTNICVMLEDSLSSIERVRSIRYLGVVIDENLSNVTPYFQLKKTFFNLITLKIKTRNDQITIKE